MSLNLKSSKLKSSKQFHQNFIKNKSKYHQNYGKHFYQTLALNFVFKLIVRLGGWLAGWQKKLIIRLTQLQLKLKLKLSLAIQEKNDHSSTFETSLITIPSDKQRFRRRNPNRTVLWLTRIIFLLFSAIGKDDQQRYVFIGEYLKQVASYISISGLYGNYARLLFLVKSKVKGIILRNNILVAGMVKV